MLISIIHERTSDVMCFFLQLYDKRFQIKFNIVSNDFAREVSGGHGVKIGRNEARQVIREKYNISI